MRRGYPFLVIAAVVTALAATEAGAGADALAVERGRAVIVKGDGRRIPLRIEIARTPDERARGLRGRRTLAPNAGMLFVYGRARRGSFWMRGTLIPLAIAFLDARGRVLRVLRMTPCRADPCRLYDPGLAYRSALEVNAASARRWRLGRGDVVRRVPG